MTNDSPRPSITPCISARMDDPPSFRMTFENGYTISIIWGMGTYSHNRSNEKFKVPWMQTDIMTAVEVAIIHPSGEMLKFDSTDDTIKGFVGPNELADIIQWTKNLSVPPPDANVSSLTYP